MSAKLPPTLFTHLPRPLNPLPTPPACGATAVLQGKRPSDGLFATLHTKTAIPHLSYEMSSHKKPNVFSEHISHLESPHQKISFQGPLLGISWWFSITYVYLWQPVDYCLSSYLGNLNREANHRWRKKKKKKSRASRKKELLLGFWFPGLEHF